MAQVIESIVEKFSKNHEENQFPSFILPMKGV